MSNAIVPGTLVLADGAVFAGEMIGAAPDDGHAVGEVVFNTVMSGYQEVLTDPSYAGQILTFTYPHIGNYGTNDDDYESAKPFCRGVIVRELARRDSNWRSRGDLQGFLEHHELAGIAGVDTRRLTRHLRARGALPGAFGRLAADELTEIAAGTSSTDGVDLVATVTCNDGYTVNGVGGRRIVAYDFGIKTTILNHLRRLGTIDVVPASTPAEDVLAREPDGVFLSNGPGDPSAVGYASDAIGRILGTVPVFGICLGHQLMCAALGAETYKLPFGHHGGNHPVQHIADGGIEITSQNHNYAVADGSLVGADVTHRNLNDGVIEGIRCRDVPAFGVQYHPEAGPGPHDSEYLFEQFADLMDSGA